MNKEEIIKQLKKEGFIDLRICPFAAGFDSGEHTHEQHTVHIILDGELIIKDKKKTKIFHKGDRVEFPVGTKHNAKSPRGGSTIVGIKKTN